jgi:NTP pyrophosphatase (non-canonical NTP hydrolase)
VDNPKITETMNRLIFDRLISDIEKERGRQRAKFGVQCHTPEAWLAILAEEVGEVAKAAIEGELLQYRKELIEVAAVAIAMASGVQRLIAPPAVAEEQE